MPSQTLAIEALLSMKCLLFYARDDDLRDQRLRAGLGRTPSVCCLEAGLEAGPLCSVQAYFCCDSASAKISRRHHPACCRN